MSRQHTDVVAPTCSWCGLPATLSGPNGQCAVCGVHRAVPVWDRSTADERSDALYQLFAAGRFREVAEAAISGRFTGLGREVEALALRAIQHALDESVGALRVYYLPIEVKGKERHGFGWVWPDTYCVTEMRLYLSRDKQARTSTVVRESREIRATNCVLESGLESDETILEVACKLSLYTAGGEISRRSYRREVKFGEGERLEG
jgi:hypothetical protein